MGAAMGGSRQHNVVCAANLRAVGDPPMGRISDWAAQIAVPRDAHVQITAKRRIPQMNRR